MREFINLVEMCGISNMHHWVSGMDASVFIRLSLIPYVSFVPPYTRLYIYFV